MAELLDNCRFTAGSSGTVDFADGAAVAGCRNLDDAGAVDGAVYPYKAQNATATQWERGYATYDEGNGTLVRNNILDSSDGGSKVDFSTNPTVIISPTPAHLVGQNVEVNGGGLATGGGNLLESRTITVPKAAGADVRAGSDDTKALTAKAVYDSAAEVTLTAGGTVSWSLADGDNFYLLISVSGTLANPTVLVVGKTGRIRIVQDGTGNRALAYGSYFDFEEGDTPDLSTAAGAEDYLDYEVVSSTKIRARLSKAWS